MNGMHVEVVIDESRTHMRLAARTLRSLTPEGVIQEIYALLLAHTVIRTLMLEAAEQAHIAPTQISFTETIRVMDENLIPLSLVNAPRRLYMVKSVRKRDRRTTLAQTTDTYSASAPVKRAYSRYDRKKPEHLQAPALEVDATFFEIIAVVPCIQGLARVPEMPLLTTVKEAPGLLSGGKTKGSGTLKSPACQSTPDREDPSSPKALADASSSPNSDTEAKTSKAREPSRKTGRICATRSP